ncbi:hypothetical protein, partial [Paenibacillus sp. AR247]|uniref:hypothetical protein n=1 Tax=Paenibacillus sp. AR247 TaxID=1631599 RepID=UPI001C614C93
IDQQIRYKRLHTTPLGTSLASPSGKKSRILGNQESSLNPYITAAPGQLRGNSSPANEPFNEKTARQQPDGCT